jgi:type I restriction enzyme, S subunit
VGFYPNVFLDNEFLFYKLKSMKELFLSTSIINTQMNLNIDRISAISISFPFKEEQTNIVQHIEAETQKIDATVLKIEKEISLLQEYRTALISEAVTGKIDVRGAN